MSEPKDDCPLVAMPARESKDGIGNTIWLVDIHLRRNRQRIATECSRQRETAEERARWFVQRYGAYY